MTLVEDNKSRSVYIDILKVIAIILVIFTHDTWAVENCKSFFFVFFVDMAVPIFMISSGYNYSNSRNCNGKDKIEYKRIIKRLKRILVPFLLIYICEVFLLWSVKNKEYTLEIFLLDMVKGGYGPGSYYTPVMIQFVLCVPILWFVYREMGIIVIFLFNFIFEVVYTYGGFGEQIYKFLFFRYIFLVALGFEMKKMEIEKITPKKVVWYISLVVGVGFLFVTSVHTPIIFKRWTTTSMLSGVYLFPMLIKLKKEISINLSIRLEKMIITLSNATFHIYLFQMMYYYVGGQRFILHFPMVIRVFVSTMVCVIGGGLFYLSEHKLSGIKLCKKN